METSNGPSVQEAAQPMPSDRADNDMPDLVRQFLHTRATNALGEIVVRYYRRMRAKQAALSIARASRNRSTSPMTRSTAVSME